ncbi:hypothetical protein ACVWY0_002951 [Arthrobacter sp. UYNi723]
MEVQLGQHSCAKQLVLAGVRSWPSWRSDDDAWLPDEAVSSELLSGEVDLEATGEPVPVMDFVLLVAAADVCNEEITAKQVLNDESCGSALTVCRIVGVPPREALGVETGRICAPRQTECSLELKQRVSHGDSVPRDYRTVRDRLTS